MPYRIGLVGKPSVGKSTFFNAATMGEAEEADYPFTTVDPSVGEAYVRVDCPEEEFDTECDPNRGFCRNGTRFVPVKLVDVAGLIPGAHEGKGLGNQFLSDLNTSDVLLHVVDLSGGTDLEGEPAEGHDPRLDVDFLEDELDMWYLEVLERGIERYENRRDQQDVSLPEELAEQMSAFGTDKNQLKQLVLDQGLDLEPDGWSQDDREELARAIRKATKPLVVAGNKIDLEEAKENYGKITSDPDYSGTTFIPCSAHAEKALKQASERGLVDYVPGSDSFEITGELSAGQREGLEDIEEVVEEFGGTGVQQALETALFDELGVIAVFPVADGVEDEKGNVLPDCFLVPAGTTAEELAYEIHSDIGEGFIHAVDVREQRQIGSGHVLEHGDVVRIVSDR